MISFFDDAITVHLEWKRRLHDFIKGNKEAPDSDIVRSDKHCELGKWIYSEGLQFSDFPAYQELVKEHAAFHQCAADVIQAVQEKNLDKAETLMVMDGQFSNASSETVGTIGRLRSEIERSSSLSDLKGIGCKMT